MPSEDARRALAAAIDESRRLTDERQRIDGRLSELAENIGTLSRFCGLAPTVPWGLADACRTVLRRKTRCSRDCSRYSSRILSSSCGNASRVGPSSFQA